MPNFVTAPDPFAAREQATAAALERIKAENEEFRAQKEADAQARREASQAEHDARAQTALDAAKDKALTEYRQVKPNATRKEFEKFWSKKGEPAYIAAQLERGKEEAEKLAHAFYVGKF